MDWSVVLLEHPSSSVPCFELLKAKNMLFEYLIDKILRIDVLLVLIEPFHPHQTHCIDHGPYHNAFNSTLWLFIEEPIIIPFLILPFPHELNA